MLQSQLIQAKRDGRELSAEEVQAFVAGVTADPGAAGYFEDAQLGAFLMAVCCRGMTVAETRALTLAMRDSGMVLDLSAIPGVKVDKHSTGGVGDKVSLLLAPLVAAAGVPVPMISGRGLGHTGGTLDKLASIPGYRTDLSEDEFVGVLAQCGFVMAGASKRIAPADRRMYATRDVTGTVESVPLITSSILAKKLAEGIGGLVLDVKVGRAAFMKTREDATALMESLVATGRDAGKQVVGLLTDMDSPLGCAIGNAVEVREIVDALGGNGPDDLWQVTRALGAEMLVLGGVAKDVTSAGEQLDQLLQSGAAMQRFVQNIELQGGDASFVDDTGLLPGAACDTAVLSPADGYVVDWDPMALGMCVVELGGGRRSASDDVDHGVGIVLQRQRGEQVNKGDELARVWARNVADMQQAVERIAGAVVVGGNAPPPRVLVLDRR